MTIVDIGNGPVIVMIPGVQGRWEWMRPAVDALARHCRVITFSLADEPTAGGAFDEQSGFDCYVEQVRQALRERGVSGATICGVSYGGLVATAFAARYPEQTRSLILVSALPPSWRPDARVSFYLKAPWLLSPLFCLGSLRLYREISAAAGGAGAAVHAAAAHGWNVITHMFSPGRMARRVRLLSNVDLAPQLESIHCDVLVVTGEEALDRVVPVRRTREFLSLPGATAVTLPRTGHLGLITRPQAFAAVVVPFVQSLDSRRRVG